MMVMISLGSINCTQAAIEPISNDPVESPKAPLQVWSVIPSWGEYDKEGFVIFINGLGFENGAQAFVGGRACLDTLVVSYKKIVCQIPPQDTHGDYSVTVMNPDGKKAPVEMSTEQKEIQRKVYEEYEDGDEFVWFYYTKPIERHNPS
jgi:hypothetical protein